MLVTSTQQDAGIKVNKMIIFYLLLKFLIQFHIMALHTVNVAYIIVEF